MADEQQHGYVRLPSYPRTPEEEATRKKYLQRTRLEDTDIENSIERYRDLFQKALLFNPRLLEDGTLAINTPIHSEAWQPYIELAKERDAWELGDPRPRWSAAINEGVFEPWGEYDAVHDDLSRPPSRYLRELRMPKCLAKKFDPYYKDYVTALRRLVDKWEQDTKGESLLRYVNPEVAGGEDDFEDNFIGGVSFEPGDAAAILARHFSLRGLLNLAKVPKDRVLRVFDEILQFDDDWNYTGPKFDSLNEFRAAPAKMAEEAERRQDENEAKERIDHIWANRDDTNGIFYTDLNPETQALMSKAFTDPEELARHEAYAQLVQLFVDRARSQRARPYDINEVVREVVKKEGWSILDSPKALLDRGKELRHCYGDIKTYGASHHREYNRRCRSHETLLLAKDFPPPIGGVTAELAVEVAGKDRQDHRGAIGGSILDVKVGQVQTYNNRSLKSLKVEYANQIKAELTRIVLKLQTFVGKTATELSDDRFKQLNNVLIERGRYA